MRGCATSGSASCRCRPTTTAAAASAPGQTHIILINRDHAERTLPPRAVALLEDRPALYVWVESLEDLRSAAWDESDTFLGEVSMAGLREWAVESEHGLLVFAENRPRPALTLKIRALTPT